MRDYGSHRPSCIADSVQKLQILFLFIYTEPRKINKREPEWLYDGAKLRENHFRPEDSVKKKDEEARELRLFAKELRKGVRQQRVRDKTKEKAGTLPLGPKNDPMPLTCTKNCKPLMQDNLKQLILKLVQFVLQREI